MTFTLSPPVTPETAELLRSNVTRALAGGAAAVAIDIDALDGLDTASISTLIRLLRAARRYGAAIELQAERAPVLAALHLTALDKLFAIEPPRAHVETPASPAVRPLNGRVRRRLAAALVGALLGFFIGRASAATEPSPDEVVAAIIAQNADMRSYQAQVNVDVHLRTFPYISQHLDGTTYFKRPDNYEVVFERVPSYATGFDKIYSDVGDPTSWPRRYDLSFVGRKSVGGHDDVVLRLVQKVRGMIDHEDVAIDPDSWRIDEMDWHYYNGGFIAMSQEYQTAGGFTVLAKQHATIRIPFVHAAAEATYGDYRTNVAIDDSVFTREKH